MARTATLRASDGDRDKTVDALSNAFSDGELKQAEYDERSAAALTASTLGELRRLVSDLQTQPALVGTPEPLAEDLASKALPPTHTTPASTSIHLNERTTRRLFQWIARLAILALLATIALVVFKPLFNNDDDDSATASTSTQGTDTSDTNPITLPGPPELLTAKGFDTFVDALETLGTTKVYGLVVYNDYASFTVKRSDGWYSYNYDRFMGEPSETTSHSDAPVDAAKVNTTQMEKLVNDLPTIVGLTGLDTAYLYFDTNSGPRPTMTVYGDFSTGTGYVTATLDGKVLAVYAG